MKLFLLVVAVAFYCTVESKRSPPKVQVYTRDPGEYGKKNTLLCLASEFHPPDITVEILDNGHEIPGAKQTDLSFGKDWHFYLTRHVEITPMEGHEYTCRVTHGEHKRTYSWEPNM